MFLFNHQMDSSELNSQHAILGYLHDLHIHARAHTSQISIQAEAPPGSHSITTSRARTGRINPSRQPIRDIANITRRCACSF